MTASEARSARLTTKGHDTMNRIVTKIANWIRGRPTLARITLRCIPDVRHTIRVDELGPFVIRLRRNRSWMLRSPIQAERSVLVLLKRYLRPGDVAYDVGANIGLYARYAVQMCGAGAVVAFEPMTENLDLLRRNIQLDPTARERVRVVESALGDTDGDEAMQIDDVMSASAALDRVTGGRPSSGRAQVGLGPKTQTVRVTRLDTLLFESPQSPPPPRLIKVDVEGAELLVLRGAERTLREHRPIVVVELHNKPDVSVGVVELLQSIGYHVFAHVADADDTGRRTYRRVSPDDARRPQAYVLHHIVASCDLTDVATPAE